MPRSALRGVYLGLLICLAVLLLQIFAGSNLHSVVPGQLYRSSQMTTAGLQDAARRLGIRTVINLRGYCAGQPWYDNECLASSRLDLSQEDICFSANHLPAVGEIRRLVEVLDRCEYPAVIHCFRGVDRTGLATMMYLLLRTDTPYEDAHRSLGLRYLHLPFGRTGHLERFFDLYEDWLEDNGGAHTSQRFRTWVTTVYTGGKCTGRIEPLGLVIAGRKGIQPLERCETPEYGPNARVRIGPIPRGIPVGVRMRFHNTSDEDWEFRRNDNAGVHAFWRVMNPQGLFILHGRAGCFNATVPPGESIDLTLLLPAFYVPGRYHMQVTMIDEQHCYFHEVGLDLLNLELEVP